MRATSDGVRVTSQRCFMIGVDEGTIVMTGALKSIMISGKGDAVMSGLTG